MLDSASKLSKTQWKGRVIRRFDQAACTYDCHAHMQQEAAKQLCCNLLKTLDANQISINSFAEVGCGTGLLTRLLCRHFPHTHALITDAADGMLRACKHKIGSHPLRSYQVADGETLHLQKHVELIVSNLAVQWFEDLPTSLNHLWKQTRVLAFSLPVQGTFDTWIAAHRRLGLQAGTSRFMSKNNVLALCNQLRPHRLFTTVQKHKTFFAHPLDFLHALKAVGACEPCPGHAHAALRPVLRSLSEGLWIHYHVMHCVLVKT